MQNDTQFNEKFEELKNYLIESAQSDVSNEIERLSGENRELKKEIKRLSEQNDELKKENKVININDNVMRIVASQVSENNVCRLIESLFVKTFDENTYDVPLFWVMYVNYYSDRKDVISLLRFAGVKIPDELEDIILPHEWDEELLDKFFDTMYAHYNCNGEIYENNLRFWTYSMAAHPFDTKYFTCYDEIHWQFVLRNPLLNSQKYAVKIAKEINKGGRGIYFSKICDYQDLSQDVLQTIISNLKVPQYPIIAGFLINHIELVTDKKVSDNLYSKLVDTYDGVKDILRMSEEYQEKYVKSLSRPEKMIDFLSKTKFSKEKKMHLLSNIFERRENNERMK